MERPDDDAARTTRRLPLTAAERGRGTRPLGQLVAFALDQLWACTPEGQDHDDTVPAWGCCPRCCLTCIPLAELHHDGLLDAWVTAASPAPRAGWWDGRHVDRQWLARAWERADTLGCH